MSFFEKLFGSFSDKELKRINPIKDKVLALEPEMAKLTDEQLQKINDAVTKALEGLKTGTYDSQGNVTYDNGMDNTMNDGSEGKNAMGAEDVIGESDTETTMTMSDDGATATFTTGE